MFSIYKVLWNIVPLHSTLHSPWKYPVYMFKYNIRGQLYFLQYIIRNDPTGHAFQETWRQNIKIQFKMYKTPTTKTNVPYEWRLLTWYKIQGALCSKFCLHQILIFAPPLLSLEPRTTMKILTGDSVILAFHTTL